MNCPKCGRGIPAGLSWCPCCGVALPVTPPPPERKRSGPAVLAALLVCAVAAAMGLRALPPVRSGLFDDAGSAGTRAVWPENPARGDAVQTKTGELGSAGFLRGDVLLVSVYVDDDKGTWDDEKRENARSCLDVACGFLEQQAAAYGETLKLHYDVRTCPDLLYHAQYSRRASDDQTGAFDRWIYWWIDENVPVAELQKRYGTDNIGFMMLVADEGGAYTNVYYMEDGARYFNENSVLFYYYPYEYLDDREVPGVYAHEILHMFGAIDLYEGSPDFSPENVAYVARTYPDDIMYGEYVKNDRPDYEEIDLEISPVTAYYLGWLEELPPADRDGLSGYERECRAGFSYDDPTFGED